MRKIKEKIKMILTIRLWRCIPGYVRPPRYMGVVFTQWPLGEGRLMAIFPLNWIMRWGWSIWIWLLGYYAKETWFTKGLVEAHRKGYEEGLRFGLKQCRHKWEEKNEEIDGEFHNFLECQICPERKFFLVKGAMQTFMEIYKGNRGVMP